jgi:hypothetical protein
VERQFKVSTFYLYLAIFQVLLYRYAGDEEGKDLFLSEFIEIGGGEFLFAKLHGQ